MNYEFHVGDYVKTRAGFIGYIDNISDLENDNIAVHVCFSDGDTALFRVNDLNVTNNFLRIGTHDFTKKEKKNIKKLNLQGYLSAQTIASVVNELVDAVNNLMKKENNE